MKVDSHPSHTLHGQRLQSIDAVIGRRCLLRPTPVRARLCARRRSLPQVSFGPAHMGCTDLASYATAYAVVEAPSGLNHNPSARIAARLTTLIRAPSARPTSKG